MPLRTYFAIVNRGSTPLLVMRARECTHGVLVSNENAMIPVDNIPTIREARYYSIDIEKREGNPAILGGLDSLTSISRKNKLAIFPGTLLEKRQYYYHVSMPVIIKGGIAGIRRKIMNPQILIDHEKTVELYREFISGRHEPHRARHHTGYNLFDLPRELEMIYNSMKKTHEREAIESLEPYGFRGHDILPIICNELPLVHKYYSSHPVDIIVHSCDTYFSNERERISRYENEARRLIEHGVTEEEFHILACESGPSPAARIYKATRASVKPCQGILE